MPAKISVGFRVGKLEVIEPTKERKNGYTIWKCRCDCGGTILLDTRYLQRGTITDCGCESTVTPRQIDISGERFGKLVAIKPTDKRTYSGSVLWLCQCDCGNTIEAPTGQLRAGYRKSCGCLSRSAKKARDMSSRRRQKETIGEDMLVGDGTSAKRIQKSRGHVSSNNKSGHTGVYYHKQSGRWIAEIRFKGKYYYLGSFKNKADAVSARIQGESIHGDFINWYYSTHPGNSAGRRKT